MDRSRPKLLILFKAARYPQAYVWFIFVSALDLMMTWVVLYFGGREVNVLADYVLDRWALPGMVVYKFALVVLVIFICEVVGHYRPRQGKRLATFAVLITLVPVIIAFTHLLAVRFGPRPATDGASDPAVITELLPEASGD